MERRTKQYKTLKGLFRAYGIRRFTFMHFMAGMVIPSANRWYFIELQGKALEDACKLFAEPLNVAPELIRNFDGQPNPLMNNLWIDLKEDGTFKGKYCSASDGDLERREFRNILKWG